jgi:hypothetical protein
VKEDLVKELRAFGTNGFMMQAADEIERLRKELTERIHMCDMRSEKILELTAERDEARRELCYTMCNQPLYSYRGQTPIEIAYHQGWDCFKEKEKSQKALDKLSELDEELGLQ